MAALSGRQKLFIVHKLACYYTLTQVCEQFKEEFGIDAPTNQIARYQVGCAAAASLSKDLVDVYNTARQEFLDNERAIPIMQRNYRGRELNWMYERNKVIAPFVAVKALEQAAKESGGYFVRNDNQPQSDYNPELEAAIQRDADIAYGPKPPVPTETPRA